jgi:hypothetical protein
LFFVSCEQKKLASGYNEKEGGAITKKTGLVPARATAKVDDDHCRFQKWVGHSGIFKRLASGFVQNMVEGWIDLL